MPLGNKENPDKIENEAVSSNIFDDFDANDSLVQEVEKLKTEYNKDIFYYVGVAGKIAQTIFWLALLTLSFFYTYIYVQKNEDFSNKQFLEPFCQILNGNLSKMGGQNYCSSAIATNKKLLSIIDEQKESQLLSILKVIPKAYEDKNFSKKKEVAFLLSKTENKVDILAVLKEFESIKYDFTGADKSQVQCENLSISSDQNKLSIDCTSYSVGYERYIKGFDAEGGNKNTVYGTSVSIANSFLNYIEKKSNKFILVDRQKIFSLNKIDSPKFGYTYSTKFKITLEINF